MNVYQEQLIQSILQIIFPEKINKVKLTKLVYFAHKELVRNGLSKINDMLFIRMPLGPVPKYFKEISEYENVKITEENIGLKYNRVSFASVKITEENEKIRSFLKGLILRLSKYKTSDLVEISHKDNTWNAKQNGEEYYINDLDLKSSPNFKRSGDFSVNIENQKIQSLLVKGMIYDMVADNTGLEYPDYK